MARSPLAPAPTIAVMPVDESTVKEEAGTPPNVTPVAPVKLEPFIFTTVPLIPEVGGNELTTAARLALIIFLKTETAVEAEFAATISGLPSPSRSPTAT